MYVLRLILEWQIASCHAETGIFKSEIKSFTLQNMAFCISESIVLQYECIGLHAEIRPFMLRMWYTPSFMSVRSLHTLPK